MICYEPYDMAFRRQAVDKFAEVMKAKLERDVYKGSWDGCSTEYLTCRAVDEMTELAKAIDSNLSKKEVTKEAADVANFVMMIADNYMQEIKPSPQPGDEPGQQE